MTKKIVINATIITMNEQNEVIEKGALAFENGSITYIGEVPRDVSSYDEVIDAQENYVLPGLINTHGHTPMSLLRGFADDLPLQEWLEDKIWPLEAKYTKEHAKWGTYLSLLEMVKTGTTTFVDMYDNMDEVAKAVDESGMRARLCRGIIGLGSIEMQNEKLEEATAFASNWHNAANGRIATMMSPHAPYTCPPDFIEKIVDKAVELNLPIHIHMSETMFEVEQNEKDYGERPVKHLEKIGVFHRPTLVAHAVHLTEEEMDILAAHDVKVSHNVISNLKLASGIAPVPRMLEKGITVSLGTDSSASNNNLDLFEELKLAATLHKGHHQNPLAIPAQTALQMATINGAKSIWLEDKIGSLEIGKEADFIIMDTKQTYYYPKTDPISHLVYSGSGRDVQDVFIQGKQIVKKRQCLTIDEEKVLYEANRLFQTLC